jgi:peptide-methionine (R)-S-oxide reductase
MTTIVTRRDWLMAGAGFTIASLFASKSFAAASRYEFNLSDTQWRARLSPGAYQTLRHEATERAFTSPLNKEHRKGIFSCAGCALPLFSSATKFDSGTGWPSFWRPLPRAVGIKTDSLLGYSRTEVHCSRCGGHLGHVFDDGPAPTGKRYCMNGVALSFKPL